MNISEISPFIRYVRYINMDKTTAYPCYVPYDARLFYVQNGEGSITADDKRYFLKKNDALFINAGIEYHLETPEEQVSYIVVNFDYVYDYSKQSIPVPPDIKEKFDASRIIHKAEFDDLKCFNKVVYFNDFRQEEYKLDRIIGEYTKKLIFHELKESKIFSEIIIECARRSKLCNLYDNNNTTEKILDYVHKNYASPITNIKIGNIFGFHPNYINSLVKISTGVSLHQYLMQIRISYAIDMLNSNKFSIAQIAEKCGFCDIFHFSRCFKSRIGKSPSKYKID